MSEGDRAIPVAASPDDRVNPIWKYVAMTVVGMLLGGAPSYISLSIDHHYAMTKTDVDGEVDSHTQAIVQSVSDLKEQVKELAGEVHELSRARDK